MVIYFTKIILLKFCDIWNKFINNKTKKYLSLPLFQSAIKHKLFSSENETGLFPYSIFLAFLTYYDLSKVHS